MTKQLRLASAAQTDVGRRRERNQDNVTSHVPPEPELLEEKGALYVVCDGMGGHAAGEVAAKLGVETIRDVYFTMRGQDVISSIAQAVKSANDAIYSAARATVEYGGMGTTCVALVIAGGRGYIVNIGDSRAYILRDGKMRQVTQDHSWVAEQVRGGVLSEEQARVHAHRNVITRSLGTQPSITADLFVETLHDGDRVLLCSDGLHGYVEEAAIFQEISSQPSPHVTVRNLIDMANANGGPDNITAVVVDVLEAPDVTAPVPLPPNATTPIEEGETQPLPVPPGVAAASGALDKTGKATKPIKTPAALEQAEQAKRKGKRQTGPGVTALRILEVAALILIGVSIWYAGFGPLATTRQADQATQKTLSQAQVVAHTAANQNPTDALQALAKARESLLTSMANPALDSSVRAQAQAFLDVQFASAVQLALQRYDAAAGITHLAFNSAATYTLACAAPGSTTPTALTALSSLVALQAPAGKTPIVPDTQLLYAVNGGALYQIAIALDATGSPRPGAITCAKVALTGVTTVTSVAANGLALDALVTTSKGVSVIRITPQRAASGALPAVKAQTLFAPPVKQGTPGAIAANGAAIYLAFSGGATPPTGIWHFQIPSKGTVPAPKTLPTPQPVTSMRFAAGALFMSLADGSLGQLDATTFQPVSVLAPRPVITASPSAYTAATPVPTATALGVTPSSTVGTGAAFGAGSTLVSDPLNPAQMLLADVSLHRIVRLTANTSGPGAGLSAQYVYGDMTSTFTMLALGGSGQTLQVYAWNGAQLIAFPIQEPAA
ncbi:MAG TPA: Stp1/IreP family PP2C-type Ser/Thr phosphatase [Ktedonobacterales bacterium]|nr:Stp1/IreP family PP2C-type Ser/Thr phosphatase [Ktedonobacterales bacterium]